MNSIEKGLCPEIPLEEAATFFLKLKYGSAGPDGHKLAQMQSKLREKCSEGAMGAAPLTPAAMGTPPPGGAPPPAPPLPATGMGKNAAIGLLLDVGNLGVPSAIGYHMGKSEGRERAVEGKGPGDFSYLHSLLVPGYLGYHAGKAEGHRSRSEAMAKEPSKTAAALSMSKVKRLAAHLPAVVAAPKKSIGKKALMVAGGVALGGATAAGVHHAHKKTAEAFRKAASDMFGDGMVSGGSVAPQVDMHQYLAMEEMGGQAEESNHADFLRQKLQDAHEQLQAAQDQASQSAQQTQQLQQQQTQHEQQLQAAQQQSQLATQAAMQNVDQAHQLAMQATTSALQAKDDAIGTHALAAKMRMSYQDLRGQIMDAVAQDAGAPVGEAIKAQGALAQTPPPGMEQPGAEQGADPNAVPAEEGAAGEAPGAEAAPTAAPVDGGPQAAGGGAGATPPGPPGGEPAPTADVGGPGQGPPAEMKQAGVAGQLLGQAGQYLKAKAPYAAAGAALGGGLTALESHTGLGGQGLRDDVSRLQGQPGSFGQALRLAAAQARLSTHEAIQKHPVAGTLAGAAIGAGAGMAMGPGIAQGFANLPEHLRELTGK